MTMAERLRFSRLWTVSRSPTSTTQDSASSLWARRHAAVMAMEFETVAARD
jgi:hypothetical protein